MTPGRAGMQDFIGRASWDDALVRADVRDFVAARLGHPEGILLIDETGGLKKGTHTVGVQRQLISKRYEKGSTLLTSNKGFGEWGQVFGDEVLATAILDRLLHHCDVVPINGPSYRLKNRLTAIENVA